MKDEMRKELMKDKVSLDNPKDFEEEFKTFEYAETNGDGVLIFSEQNEEQAERRLKEVVKFPSYWRLEISSYQRRIVTILKN